MVLERTDGTESLNCFARADAYLGVPVDRHADDLAVVEREASCLVPLRGDNVQTPSQRNLR